MPPILFRDDRFVVLDKPPGLPVHPGTARRRERGGLVPAAVAAQGTGHGWRTGWMPTPPAVCLVALRRSALLAAQAEFAAGTGAQDLLGGRARRSIGAARHDRCAACAAGHA